GSNGPVARYAAAIQRPVASTTRCACTLVPRQTRPAAAATVAPFAATSPATKLTFDATGRSPAQGHAVRNPGSTGSTTVTLNCAATASLSVGALATPFDATASPVVRVSITRV